MEKDYYKILKVSITATQDEIKKAFRQLAKKYHPDRNQGSPNAETIFKKLQEAYEVLVDPEKRRRYDQIKGYNRNQRETEHKEEFYGFWEFFQTQVKKRRKTPVYGEDLKYKIEITLKEAAKGVRKNFTINRFEVCPSCNAYGHPPNAKVITCPVCHGKGSVRKEKTFFTINQICERCKGEGKIYVEKCERCNGLGRINVSRDISVNIPAGIVDGTSMKLTGEGGKGTFGGKDGDLFIVVKIKEDPLFKRLKDDILLRLPLSISEAAIGGIIEIPSLEGKIKMEVPAGTQSGDRIIIKNKGMPKLESKKRGNFIVEFIVEVPVELTEKQKELLTKLENEIPITHYPARKEFKKRKKQD